MRDITLILLAAGSSTRFESLVKKQWIYIDDEPLWLFVANQFKKYNFNKTIVVTSKKEMHAMKKFAEFTYVEGGNSRQTSLQNALISVESPYVLVTDVARCCIDHEMIERILNQKGEADCIVPAITPVDTIYYDNTNIDRDSVKLIQTPQLSVTQILKQALCASKEFTDESSAIVAQKGKIKFVAGSQKATKLTTKDDLKKLNCLQRTAKKNLIGFGIDTHQFESGKKMFLGGITIESEFGFKAHSDGDVLIHSIIDALLGASALGDIGEFFPDNDSAFKNIDSTVLLQEVVTMINEFGFEIVNIDTTIVAQKPKISGYKDAICAQLSKIMGLEQRFINIKATTSEKMGFIGRSEGISVHSVANITYRDWSTL
ncbi:MAG: bifunctional 2-C-methyl-D-erythritol 4-phosphate cytidylyltransferase/2-C-methyl-D-erythritol 2,4-cyclodiphosphate synthase [Campylobacterales bacterium]|nr:bifunctional 2-C-methyl-D-erythritol 4-phosphate cytidylyltransferase/2-C-methyl-D-erythritol 2,4-cyclodiphosphate synthase [Campylobacterales bacterium]